MRKAVFGIVALGVLALATVVTTRQILAALRAGPPPRAAAVAPDDPHAAEATPGTTWFRLDSIERVDSPEGTATFAVRTASWRGSEAQMAPGGDHVVRVELYEPDDKELENPLVWQDSRPVAYGQGVILRDNLTVRIQAPAGVYRSRVSIVGLVPIRRVEGKTELQPWPVSARTGPLVIQ